MNTTDTRNGDYKRKKKLNLEKIIFGNYWQIFGKPEIYFSGTLFSAELLRPELSGSREFWAPLRLPDF